MGHVTVNEVHEWAQKFLHDAETELTDSELKEQHKYAVLVRRPGDKVLLSKMLDESSQIRSSRKLSRRMKVLIERYGVPGFFGSGDRFLLKLFVVFGHYFDFIAIPIFKWRLRRETSGVIIDEARPRLTRHLAGRNSASIGQNVNLLGEVVLGDGEAEKRYEHYLEALAEPDINYISIKISGIYAQLHPLNYDHSKEELCRRLASIYRRAMENPYTGPDGVARAKFVNLDMEEYKDTELTLDIFMEVLSMPEFKDYRAGIVVQAYLPDAWNLQSKLLEFARKRVADGGAPVKMRLVKGANLQVETIVSSLKGWENPVLHTKIEVDANYLHILDRALEPENIKAVNIGVASHNFFSIAYAYLLGERNGVGEYLTFEMLEGMANHLPRLMRKLGRQIILYTPVVKNEHFLNAVSYLVRRLDENTGKDNFLSYSFNLRPGSAEWDFLYGQFREAYAMKDSIESRSYRTQDRRMEPAAGTDMETFRNEPDTNFDLKTNREWAHAIRDRWMKSVANKPYLIPVQMGDVEIATEKRQKYFDRSQDNEVCLCEVAMSDIEHTREIMNIAIRDAQGWRKTNIAERNRILHEVARNLSDKRGDLIGCMAAITGKTFMEGDVEVSEAIDFCRYYPISMMRMMELDTVSFAPKGVVMVIPPWNFPLAIPVGGVAAALAAGNTVILKPATVAMPVAWEFVRCFWDAGVPRDALQVVCTAGREPLNYLTAHPVLRHIIFTGGTDTALRLLAANPRCPISAETGGKNAMILTGSGDQDHAILNVVNSAFGNAGQKCSACSLLLVEKEVYNDPVFKTKLHDAVTSMHTGSVWDFGNVIGPMIDNDNEKLLHAIGHLEEGESWLVAPEFVDNERYIMKPAVKWGVKPGSYTFRTELFAPLLGVVCVDSLKEAVKLVNSSEYGLTSGLQSLDEAEIEYWKETVEAGNLYINRGITGAIVGRQPFGGMKRSAFGGGIKAGGPNYVACFTDITELCQPQPDDRCIVQDDRIPLIASILGDDDRQLFHKAAWSYEKSMMEVFIQEDDVNNLIGESNIFRYRPLQSCAIRVQDSDRPRDVAMVIAAACIARTPLTVSIDPDNRLLEALRYNSAIELVVEENKSFLDSMGRYERIRTCTDDLPDAFYSRAAELGKYIATATPMAEGRIELLHYLKEQSVSYEYHRYGSILE